MRDRSEPRTLRIVKTAFKKNPAPRLVGLGALIAGLALAAPLALAGSDAPAATSKAKTCGACCCAPAKAAKSAKATKKVKKQKAAAHEVTGSRTQKIAKLERFPATTSPVEIMDRAVIERSGASTLSWFLNRQTAFR